MGTGEGFASAGSDGWVGPPNIGLSPERIRILSEEAKTRIAAENAAKEAHKAERAQLKADKKAKKSGEKDQVYEQDGSQKLDVNQSCEFSGWEFMAAACGEF